MRENKNLKDDKQYELKKALETVANAVVGDELGALKEAIDSLNTSLNEQTTNLKNSVSSDIQDMKNKLTLQVNTLNTRLNYLEKNLDEEKKVRENSHISLEKQVTNSGTSLRDLITQVESKATDNLNSQGKSLRMEIKNNVEKINTKMENTQWSLAQNAKSLAMLEQERIRVAAILENFGKIFMGATNMAAPPSPVQESTSSKSKNKKDSAQKTSTSSDNYDEIAPEIKQWIDSQKSNGAS